MVNNIHRLFICVVCTLLLCTGLVPSAYAADISGEQTSSEDITITGSVGTGDTVYTIMVFAPGKDASDLDLSGTPAGALTNLGVVAYQGQGVSESDGSFSVSFKLDSIASSSGEYTVALYSAASGSVSSDGSFVFVNAGDFEDTIDNLNAEAKKANGDVAKFLTDNWNKLGFSKSGITATDAKIAEVLKGEILRADLPNDDMDECLRRYRLSAFTASLLEGNIDNIFSFTSILNSDACKANLESEMIASDGLLKDTDLQKKITTAVSKRSIADSMALNRVLYEEIVLEIIEAPNGVDNARRILKGFKASTGADAASLTDTELNSVTGTRYSSISALITALSDADDGSVTNPGTTTTTGRPTGGGGGGFTAGPSVDNKPIEQIPMDVYTDLDEAIWARNAIVYLTDAGILAGRSKDKFEPNANIKREEFAKMLVVAFADNAIEAELSFADTDKNAWYYPYIAKAVGAGIVGGYSETEFGIGDLISREDMAVMAYRAVSEMLKTADGNVSFSDEAEIADYAKEAIKMLNLNGIINGVGDGRFAPKGTATRAEAAKIIYEIMSKLY